MIVLTKQEMKDLIRALKKYRDSLRDTTFHRINKTETHKERKRILLLINKMKEVII